MLTKPASQDRRKFLSNMGILATGAAFAPAINFVYGKPAHNKPFQNCTRKWDSFCKLHDAQALHTATEFYTDITPCNGHTCKHGTAMLFEHAQLIAQPVWIFWAGVNKLEPSDVIIHFYKKTDKSKIATLNQFELEALYHFCKTSGKKNLSDVLCRQKENSKENFIAKTIVRKNTSIKIYSDLTKEAITINNNNFFTI